jgi:hypothetical protein
MNSILFGSKNFNEFINGEGDKTICTDDKVNAYKYVFDFILYALFANEPLRIKLSPKNTEHFKSLCHDRRIDVVNLTGTELIYHVKPKEEKKPDNSCLFRFATSLTECRQRYAKLYAPVFEGKSNFDLIIATYKEKPRISLVPLADYLEVTENEYQELLDKIIEACQYYDDELDSYRNLPLKQIFHKIKIEENSDHALVIDKVQAHLNELNTSKHQYVDALEQEIHLLKESNVLKIKEIKDEILSVKVLIDSFEDQHGLMPVEKPGLLNFNKLDKEKYEQYQSLLSGIKSIENSVVSKYPSEHFHFSSCSLPELKEKIITALEILPVIEDILHNQSRILIKRINHLNDTKFVFSSLFEKLTLILDNMNESGLYNEKFECNARSTLMQHEWVDNLSKDLDIEVRQLKILPKFFQWTNYISHLDVKSKKLIQSLMSFPKKLWIEVFEDSYLYYYKNEKITINSLVDEERYNLLISDLKIVKEHLIAQSQKYRKTFHKLIFDYYKKQDAKKYKNLRETGKMEDLCYEVENLPVYAPCIYLESSESVNQNQILLKYGQAKTLINIVVGDEANNRVLNQIFLNQEIKDIPLAERIGSARLLSKSIMEVTHQFKIYHLPVASLIVVDNDVLPRAVENTFDSKILKHVQIGNKKEDVLLETMLITDQPVYLICSDGILDQNFNNSLLWQIHLTEGIKNAGIKVISVWTTETKGRIEQVGKIIKSNVYNM